MKLVVFLNMDFVPGIYPFQGTCFKFRKVFNSDIDILYIAFNTLGDGLKRIVMEVHEGTAGKGTWRGDNMMLEPIRHAHVLHGRGVFSKHDLADGVYDTVHLKHLDPRLLPEYCLLVVVQSIRMPSTVLKELVAAPKLLDTSR